jgi:hypothetical protein
MFLRWFTFALALTLGCTAPPAARADSDIPVHAGLWGLELGVQALSGSGSFIGLAARHHTADRSAIRLGISGRLTSSDGDETSEEGSSYPDTSVSVKSRDGISTDERDAALFAHWVRYLGLEEHFGMTLEVGPTVHWSSAEYSRHVVIPESALNADQRYDYLEDRNSWEYGLDVQMGFEWFFTRHVSLASRFGIAALRTDKRRTTEEILSSDYYGLARHTYAEDHTDGFVVRTLFPLVSLNASW